MREEFCSGEKSAMERDSIIARDFLGLNNGRNLSGDSQQVLKPHPKDKVGLGNMSLHWPYSNKAAALQQFISFKSLQDGSKKSSSEKLLNSAFHAISTADAFDLKNRNTTGSQKTLYLDPSGRDVTDSGIYHFGQNSGVSRITFPPQTFHDRGAQGYNIQEGGMFPCSNYSLSVSNGGFPAYFNGQQATAASLLAKQFQGVPPPGQNSFVPILGASVGTTKPGGAPNVSEKPTNAQLTIFYGGTVNVYDDVPADKAQAIMFLAGNGNSSSGKTASPQPQSSTISLSVSSDGHANHAASFCSSALNTLPVTSPQVYPHKSQTTALNQTNQSTAVMPTTGDPETKQSNATSNSQQEIQTLNDAGSTPTSLVSRAVPQARKASLARFLEKRKERVCTKAPYQTKKPSEDSSHSDKDLSPNCSSTLSVDGGKSQHMFIPKSEEKGSQPWQLEVKNEVKECKLQLT